MDSNDVLIISSEFYSSLLLLYSKNHISKALSRIPCYTILYSHIQKLCCVLGWLKYYHSSVSYSYGLKESQCTYHSLSVRVQRWSGYRLLTFSEIRKLWPPVQINRKVCWSYGTGHNVHDHILQLYFVHWFTFNVSHLGQHYFYLKFKTIIFGKGTIIVIL